MPSQMVPSLPNLHYPSPTPKWPTIQSRGGVPTPPPPNSICLPMYSPKTYQYGPFTIQFPLQTTTHTLYPQAIRGVKPPPIPVLIPPPFRQYSQSGFYFQIPSPFFICRATLQKDDLSQQHRHQWFLGYSQNITGNTHIAAHIGGQFYLLSRLFSDTTPPKKVSDRIQKFLLQKAHPRYLPTITPPQYPLFPSHRLVTKLNHSLSEPTNNPPCLLNNIQFFFPIQSTQGLLTAMKQMPSAKVPPVQTPWRYPRATPDHHPHTFCYPAAPLRAIQARSQHQAPAQSGRPAPTHATTIGATTTQ